MASLPTEYICYMVVSNLRKESYLISLRPVICLIKCLSLNSLMYFNHRDNITLLQAVRILVNRYHFSTLDIENLYQVFMLHDKIFL